MKDYISKLRKDYGIRELTEDMVDPDPLLQFEKWFTEAANMGIVEPNAMTISTSGRDGKVSARIVLLRNFDEKGFVFYTNYNSRKGHQIAENPYACLSFFWCMAERQVRIAGRVEKISTLESMEYFNSRPLSNRIGSWASDQSTVLESREALEEKVQELEKRYANSEPEKPPFWGGYRVVPEEIEFWQGRPSRLHDRLQYTRTADGKWKMVRLNP